MLLPTAAAVGILCAAWYAVRRLVDIVTAQLNSILNRPKVFRETSADSMDFLSWMRDVGLLGALGAVLLSATVSIIRVLSLGCCWRVHSDWFSSVWRCGCCATSSTVSSARRCDIAHDVLAGVVLSPPLHSDVASFCRSIHAARQRGRPFRNCLLYGPPGTGKTLLAKRIAKSCGLAFAMASGGDIASLGSTAVPELNRMFEWATHLASSGDSGSAFEAVVSSLLSFCLGKAIAGPMVRWFSQAATAGPWHWLHALVWRNACGPRDTGSTPSQALALRGGAVLFIDECESFLGTRSDTPGDGSVSQGHGATLSTFLSLTGSQRTDVMVILASNRPGDLDSAVTDRMDLALSLPLPGLRERRMLLRQLWHVLIMPHVLSGGPDMFSQVIDTSKVLGDWGRRQSDGRQDSEAIEDASLGAAAAAAGCSVDELPQSVPVTSMQRCAAMWSDVNSDLLDMVARDTSGFSGR